MEGLYTVNVLGRERDVYFGMPAIEYVYQKIDFSVFARMENNEYQSTDLKTLTHFVYGGLYGGCELNDSAMDFGYKDVYVIVEKMAREGDPEGIMEKVSRAFAESSSNKYILSQAESVEVKKKKTKKLIGEKSGSQPTK